MNFLKRYSLLALAILLVELLIIYLCRKPIKSIGHIPKTFQETTKENKTIRRHAYNNSAEDSKPDVNIKKETISELEEKLIKAGLTNISELDSTIVIDLKYATKDNFLHKNLYGNVRHGYLQRSVAEKLARAQKQLKLEFPFYSLIVFDAARPLSIQKVMWNEMQVPENQKDNYVSNPVIGSLHNYGCAVDVSIINEDGLLLDMGTPYDFFGRLAYPIAEQEMMDECKLSSRQYENRKLLRRIMINAGFTPITSEWWHFNGSSLKIAGEKYLLID